MGVYVVYYSWHVSQCMWLLVVMEKVGGKVAGGTLFVTLCINNSFSVIMAKRYSFVF